MRIAHLSFSDCKGGAAIGAYRLHHAMLDAGLDSHMLVMHSGRLEPEIHLLLDRYNRKVHVSSIEFSQKLKALYDIPGLPIRSFNLHGTDTAASINRFRPDIVQMHWIGMNTIRIDDIRNIRAPVVWKMPDMWAFSGAEHYTNADAPQRHREGYDRVPAFRGEAMDIDRLVWEYKRLHYGNIPSLTMVSPSRFLAIEAHHSILLGDRNCHVIPNPLPAEYMRIEPITPAEQHRLREQLGIAGKRLVVFFGAYQTSERRKGFHHIEHMIEHHLPGIIHSDELAFVVAGGSEQQIRHINGYEVRIYPTTSDFRLYVSYLRSCDLLILPSEMENSAMVIQEALACGIPAVVFSIGGMADLVHHHQSGYLARPYDAGELAGGIRWWLECPDKEAVRDYARRLARSAHDPGRCAGRYARLYQEILERTRTGRPVTKGRLFDRDAGQLVTARPVKLLVIAPSVRDWTSTSQAAATILALHAQATAAGIFPEILGDRESAAPPGIDIVPVFESRLGDPAAAGDAGPQVPEQADERLVDHVTGILSGIITDRKMNARDALFFPAPDEVQFAAMLRLVATRDHPDFPGLHVNATPAAPDIPAGSPQLRDILRAVCNTGYVGRRIFMYADTETAARHLTAATDLDFALLDTADHAPSGHAASGGPDDNPLIRAVLGQGLAKNETVLYVGDDPAAPEPQQWRGQHGAKVIFLCARDGGTMDQDTCGPYPRPGEPFFMQLAGRRETNGSWTLPPLIKLLLAEGKLKHVVFEKDALPSLKDALAALCQCAATGSAPPDAADALFIEADPSRHKTPGTGVSVQAADATGRGMWRRLPRAVLRRGKNLMCRLCR